MTDSLRNEALAFLDQVEKVAADRGYQQAVSEYEAKLNAQKAEFDSKIAKMQADFDKQIVLTREEYYNKGYTDCSHESGAQVSVPLESVKLIDGQFVGYSVETAHEVASFSYVRVFKTTGWGTIVLPVALVYSDWSSKFEVAEIIGVEPGKSMIPKRQILKAGSQMLPNHPYQIRVKKASTTAVTITKKNCTVYPTVPGKVSFAVDGKKYTFRGVYQKLYSADLVGKYYASNGVFVEAISNCNPMRVILEIE